MIKRIERPRELKWYQAGAMLYGDWGTSKAYVLGIAFALAGHASWFLLGIMSLLTILVGFCYTIICRVYPDGGGVYSSLRNRSKPLAVLGALLLIADYAVTASLSTLSAFHYFNTSNPVLFAMGAIALIGAINWIGPSKSGNLATFVGVLASISAIILFGFTVPHLPHVNLQMPTGTFTHNWSSFVGIVLALSGVEAIANMTGVMVLPVDKTSKRAIWPVLLEVALLTFLLGIAMNAIPNLTGHTEDMLRAIANHYIAPWYGTMISILFAFLLLSATNSAINGLVSIKYAMGKDRELPEQFTQLNRFGMPWLGLIVATIVPILVLFFVNDLVGLAALYAIGVVGAITINLGACALNYKINLKRWERSLLYAASLILLFVEVTIAFQKHAALLFAIIIVAVGLILRYLGKTFFVIKVPEFVPSAEVLTVSEAKDLVSLYKSSFLVAIKQMNLKLLEDTALMIKARGENSAYVCYVEESPAIKSELVELEPSAESIELLAKVEEEMAKSGITVIPLWQTGTEPGKRIAETAKELDVKTVTIGATQRSALVNLFRGDVLRQLAQGLQKDCHLVIVG